MSDPVRPLVAIAGGEALACVALTVVVGLGALGSDLDAWIAVATLVMWLVITAGLALIWWGLYRRRRAARSPFLLTQAFALVVAWALASSDLTVDRVAGIALAVAAVVGLVIGLRPAVRETLV
jgi:sulfite exporter TauE/SafE